MKKIIKRIGAIALSCVTMFCITSCKDKDLFTIIQKDGYTYYYYNEGEYYHLTGDKKEDNPTCWIVEPFLDGKEVRYFGLYWGGGWSQAASYVPSLINVEELYLPYNMLVPKGLSSVALKYQTDSLPNKIFLINNAKDEDIVNDPSQGTNGYMLFAYTYMEKESLRDIYFTPIGYKYRAQKLLNNSVPWTDGTQEYPSGEYYFYRESDVYNDLYVKICKANTSYMFNYENSPNDDYFFIRDYEYGEKIETVPYEPIRERYTFDGWYKEPECINAWDFEEDTLPETLYNENNEEVYQETKLYAKWIKNPSKFENWWSSIF